jgi:hypothetical protein
MCVRSMDLVFTIFFILFCNCSDSMVFIVCLFYIILQLFRQYGIYCLFVSSFFLFQFFQNVVNYVPTYSLSLMNHQVSTTKQIL